MSLADVLDLPSRFYTSLDLIRYLRIYKSNSDRKQCDPVLRLVREIAAWTDVPTIQHLAHIIATHLYLLFRVRTYMRAG